MCVCVYNISQVLAWQLNAAQLIACVCVCVYNISQVLAWQLNAAQQGYFSRKEWLIGLENMRDRCVCMYVYVCMYVCVCVCVCMGLKT